MIKPILLSLWSMGVALGAAYLGLVGTIDGVGGSGKAADTAQKLTHVRVRPISVPITVDGRIGGYVVAQLVYSAPAEQLKKLEVKPDVFLFDAAFSAIFTRQKLDLGALGKDSWREFSTHVKDAVNARLGAPIVQDIIAEELGFVPYEQSRGRADAAVANARRQGGGPRSNK